MANPDKLLVNSEKLYQAIYTRDSHCFSQLISDPKNTPILLVEKPSDITNYLTGLSIFEALVVSKFVDGLLFVLAADKIKLLPTNISHEHLTTLRSFLFDELATDFTVLSLFANKLYSENRDAFCICGSWIIDVSEKIYQFQAYDSVSELTSFCVFLQVLDSRSVNFNLEARNRLSKLCTEIHTKLQDVFQIKLDSPDLQEFLLGSSNNHENSISTELLCSDTSCLYTAVSQRDFDAAEAAIKSSVSSIDFERLRKVLIKPDSTIDDVLLLILIIGNHPTEYFKFYEIREYSALFSSLLNTLQQRRNLDASVYRYEVYPGYEVDITTFLSKYSSRYDVEPVSAPKNPKSSIELFESHYSFSKSLLSSLRIEYFLLMKNELSAWGAAMSLVIESCGVSPVAQSS